MSHLHQLADRLLSTDWRSGDYEVGWKPDESPVSSVDLQLNALVSEYLISLWPDIWVVSEEDADSLEVPDPTNVAVVDPLDGTENFISGLPLWGVSVAVWRDGSHLTSLLAFPELGLTALTGEIEPRFHSRIVGHPSSSPLASLGDASSGPENRILGSAAFNLFCVATGRMSDFVNRTGAHAWDIAAGLNLALERGCGVTVDDKEYAGEFLDPRRRYRFSVHR